MRGKWLWVVLAISLAFNVFFAGGAILSHIMGPRLWHSPENRIEKLAEALDLSTAQRDELVAIGKEIREMGKGMRALRKDRRKAFIALMAQPTLDRETVATLVAEGSAQRETMIINIAERVHGYIWSLSPEQREGFLEMAKKRDFLKRLFGFRRGHDRDHDKHSDN